MSLGLASITLLQGYEFSHRSGAHPQGVDCRVQLSNGSFPLRFGALAEAFIFEVYLPTQ